MPNVRQPESGQLQSRLAELSARFEEFKKRGLALDMTRGNPCPEQLDLSLGLLDCVTSDHFLGEGRSDYRGYGGIGGIAEARRFFADFIEADPEETIVGGNSSLNMMHDAIRDAMFKGVVGGDGPWAKRPEVKFICPAPGYDRHFNICDYYGIEMITVPMGEDGAPIDYVETLVAGDPSIRAMWSVPKYSNPTGVTYSDEVVERLAAMPTAAPDFRIFFDNAYTVHHLRAKADPLLNLLEACKRAGNPDRPYVFASTSKVSFAAGGVGVMAASRANVQATMKNLSTQCIGPDKLNQLRHVLFFRDMDGIAAHMRQHAAIIGPKFDAVDAALDNALGGKDLARWSRPNGGYFISIDTLDGCAREVVKRAADAGVKLTPAGATFPHGDDPHDTNIRIAPTFPAVDDVATAMELVALCIELVSLEKLLSREE